MDINPYKIIHVPSKQYLYQIYKWLKEELNFGNSFFYNFSIIKEQLNKGNGICLVNDNDEVIGFIIYCKFELYAEIQIANVKYKFKGLGFSKIMLDYVERYLIEQNILVLELFCSPLSSKPIWLKLGFSEFQDKELLLRYKSKVYLYKVLVNCRLPLIEMNPNLDSYLELDKKVWELKKSELGKPIIYCIGENNIVNYVINQEVIYNGTVKKFQNYYTGNYLILMM